jgi:preprotein translocase SecE subunit
MSTNTETTGHGADRQGTLGRIDRADRRRTGRVLLLHPQLDGAAHRWSAGCAGCGRGGELHQQLRSVRARIRLESHFELRKIVWPTGQETRQTTLVIFIVVVIVSLLLFLFDSILVWIFEWLFTSGG